MPNWTKVGRKPILFSLLKTVIPQISFWEVECTTSSNMDQSSLAITNPNPLFNSVT